MKKLKKKLGSTVEADAQRLVHQLEVHHVELELQNEELRAMRLELEAGLVRFREIFEFAPIGYAALSPDGIIRELNLTGAQLLARERTSLVGQSFISMVGFSDHGSLRTMLARAMAHEEKQTCELVLLPRNKAPLRARIWVAASASSTPTVLIAFEDITPQRAREEKLAQTEQALREADRRKDEFLAVLSHELRNPLAPIRNSLFVLMHSERESSGARKAETIIERQVTHMAQLIDDLLDVTRISRGKIELRRRTTDLVELVRGVLEDHVMSLKACGLTLESQLPLAPLWVDADATRLVQAISNVVANAEKFTPSGGHVSVRLTADHGRAWLQIRDTGVGILRELLDHVFEPFAQAPQSADRRHGGLGLGLAMVKGLIELHGGSVAITSDGPGRGTEVTMSLQLIAAIARQAPNAVMGPIEPRRVLVIEDNVDAADSLREILRLSGHEVAVAFDGKEGIKQARALRPEIVICDLGLPELDGFAVARALRADPTLRGLMLVALSGYARPEDQAKARAAGFDAHVAKPADLSTLERIISRAGTKTVRGERPGEAGPCPC